jgi:hypothetical protein
VRRAAAAAGVALLLGSSACGAGGADEARRFTEDALAAAGLGEVEVARATSDCQVEDLDGTRTTASTEIGEVSLCVSTDQGRALSVRDPGLTDEQFERLEAYRGETPQDRARPLAAASAGLLLAGTVIQLLLRLRPPRGRPS